MTGTSLSSALRGACSKLVSQATELHLLTGRVYLHMPCSVHLHIGSRTAPPTDTSMQASKSHTISAHASCITLCFCLFPACRVRLQGCTAVWRNLHCRPRQGLCSLHHTEEGKCSTARLASIPQFSSCIWDGVTVRPGTDPSLQPLSSLCDHSSPRPCSGQQLALTQCSKLFTTSSAAHFQTDVFMSR